MGFSLYAHEVKATVTGKVTDLLVKDDEFVHINANICIISCFNDSELEEIKRLEEQEKDQNSYITMPKADSDDSYYLVKWRIKVGDTIKMGDIIAEITTKQGASVHKSSSYWSSTLYSKYIHEVKATTEGKVLNLLVSENDLVPINTNICLVKNFNK